MVSEAEGCAILAAAFTARGYAIARDVPFAEGGVRCTLDGWDAGARVGFEYLVHAEGDHEDLTPEEQRALAERMARGELYVLLVDELTDADDLRFAATHFLDEVERRRTKASGTTADPAKPNETDDAGGPR